MQLGHFSRADVFSWGVFFPGLATSPAPASLEPGVAGGDLGGFWLAQISMRVGLANRRADIQAVGRV